jgi:hypothetical protein
MEWQSEPEECDNYTVKSCILGIQGGGACRTRAKYQKRIQELSRYGKVANYGEVF